MSVPKAPPDLNDEFAIFKNDVGAPWKFSVMYAVSVSSRENIFVYIGSSRKVTPLAATCPAPYINDWVPRDLIDINQENVNSTVSLNTPLAPKFSLKRANPILGFSLIVKIPKS